MVDLTPIEGQELSVDVLDLQALSTPSALAADVLGALGGKYGHHEHHDCDGGHNQNVAAACLLVTTALTVF